MAVQTGLRTTYQTITTEGRIVRVPDRTMTMLEANERAFTTFMLGMNKKSVIESPRIEHYEDELMNAWVVAPSQVAANASSTTITFTDGTPVVVGDILMVPSGSSSAHERMRVTAKGSANVATVVRNIGSTGLLTITAGAGLVILGQAFEEGSGAPVSKRTTPTLVSGYTQIFKKSLNITGTDAKTKKYSDTGDERKRLRTKMLMEYKKQMNYQFLWGAPSEDLSGGPSGNPIRTSGGLYHYISTNKQDGGGMLTQLELETFSRMAFRYGSKTKMLLASPIIISAFHQWGNEFMKLEPGAKKFGVDLEKIVTGHGTWILVRDWSLEDGVSGQNGLGGYALSIDYENVEIRYLKDRDTRTTLDSQPKDEDRHLDMVEGELGLQVKNERTHAALYNVTSYETA